MIGKILVLSLEVCRPVTHGHSSYWAYYVKVIIPPLREGRKSRSDFRGGFAALGTGEAPCAQPRNLLDDRNARCDDATQQISTLPQGEVLLFLHQRIDVHLGERTLREEIRTAGRKELGGECVRMTEHGLRQTGTGTEAAHAKRLQG